MLGGILRLQRHLSSSSATTPRRRRARLSMVSSIPCATSRCGGRLDINMETKQPVYLPSFSPLQQRLRSWGQTTRKWCRTLFPVLKSAALTLMLMRVLRFSLRFCRAHLHFHLHRKTVHSSRARRSPVTKDMHGRKPTRRYEHWICRAPIVNTTWRRTVHPQILEPELVAEDFMTSPVLSCQPNVTLSQVRVS